MNKVTIKLIFILISISIYLFVSSFDISGVDIVYENVYLNTDSFNTFRSFINGQGYPSVPLWLYYIFSNKLGFNYELAHLILGSYYIFNILEILLVSKNKLNPINNKIFKINFFLFLIFGQFGITLLLSAEKMLLAMIFFMLATKASIKKDNKLKSLFYIFSIGTHFTMIVTIFLIEYESLQKTLTEFIKKFIKYKIKIFSIFVLTISSIFGAIGFKNIAGKLGILFITRELIVNSDTSNTSYLTIVLSTFIIFFIISKLNYKNILIAIISNTPVFLKIPLGRISWLYTFAIFFIPFISNQKIRNENILILFLSSLTFYYIYKSIMIFQAGSF